MEMSITLSIERYNQLIRAEHDANHFKAMIADKLKTYDAIPYTEVATLYSMYNGDKENDNV